MNGVTVMLYVVFALVVAVGYVIETMEDDECP